jgi:hypothetical protein
MRIADTHGLIDWEVTNRETLHAKTYTIVFENINDPQNDVAGMIMHLWFLSLDQYAKTLSEHYEGFAEGVYRDIRATLREFIMGGNM